MTFRSPLARCRLVAVLLVAATACASEASQGAADETTATSTADSTTTVVVAVATNSGTNSDTTTTETTIVDVGSPTTAADTTAAPTSGLAKLPVREGPRRETTHGVPHVQTDAVLVPEVDAELSRRAFSLPGVESRDSAISLAGARSLWLADDVDVARPEVLFVGREFGHIHADGSLHLWLPADRAFEVAETKWGELHPWVGRADFWDGTAMVYNPETMDELDITIQLIVDAYNYVTGADLDPATFS